MNIDAVNDIVDYVERMRVCVQTPDWCVNTLVMVDKCPFLNCSICQYNLIEIKALSMLKSH